MTALMTPYIGKQTAYKIDKKITICFIRFFGGLSAEGPDKGNSGRYSQILVHGGKLRVRQLHPLVGGRAPWSDHHRPSALQHTLALQGELTLQIKKLSLNAKKNMPHS